MRSTNPNTIYHRREVTVCEVMVGAAPLKVFDTIFGAESEYRAKMVAKEVRDDMSFDQGDMTLEGPILRTKNRL